MVNVVGSSVSQDQQSVHIRLPIVVHIHDFETSRFAVDLAAAEAARAGLALHVLLVLEKSGLEKSGLEKRGSASRNSETRTHPLTVVAAAVAHARKILQNTAVGPQVTGSIANGSATAVLGSVSDLASVLVLAGGGRESTRSATVSQVIVDARCPVMVAPRSRHRSPASLAKLPVVVGLDGSPNADNTTSFAFEQAAARDVELVMLHAWRTPEPHLRVRAVTDPLTMWRDRYPKVIVRVRLTHGFAADELVTESAQAGLVVVGAQGAGGSADRVGSTGEALLRGAHCPIAVVTRQKMTNLL